MKRLLTSLLVALSLIMPVAIAAPASAAVNIVPQCNSSLKNTSFCTDVKSATKGNTPSNPVLKIIKVVIIIISWVTGIAAVILILISGIKFVTSGGDSSKVASAKGSLINAMIGIAITILAQTIVVFVINKLNP